MRWTPDRDAHLSRLLVGGDEGLDAGAELEVRDPDGAQALLAPLARHHRFDADDGCLWVRPIVGGYEPDPRQTGEPAYAFDLYVARRRALAATRVRRDGDELTFDLAGGQQARIRPARPALLAELERWDTWYYLHLSAEEQADLDALVHDTG